MFKSARCLILLALTASLHAATKKVIVISIDGLRGTTLASLSTRNLQTPNLNEFANAGALSDGLLGVYPTVTYPSHTTLVTGVTPDQHGILGNLMFDPEHELDAAWYWYAQQIQRPTLYTIAKDKGLTTASVFWPVTVAARIDYNFPEYREPDTEESLLLYGGLCTQGLFAAYEKATHPLKAEHIDDDARASMANYLIATYQPDLLFIHFADVDHQEHLHGPDSTESLKSVENVDRLIGLIRQQVKTSEPNAQVDFIIVSRPRLPPRRKTVQPQRRSHQPRPRRHQRASRKMARLRLRQRSLLRPGSPRPPTTPKPLTSPPKPSNNSSPTAPGASTSSTTPPRPVPFTATATASPPSA
ncbi:MAG: alkaline phosphatase family protein [Edaphobacter sp.]